MRKMETHSRATISTTDLTLATFLVLKGYEPTMKRTAESENGHPIGAWEFPAEAATWLDEFRSGRSTVEPRAFHSTLTKVRSKLFRFLAIDNNR